MSVRTARIALTRASTPMDYPDLGIRFVRKTVADIKGKGGLDMVLVEPASALLPVGDVLGKDGSYFHVLGGLILKTSDGRSADGEPGQLIVTERRVIGMIEAGASESGPLGLDTVGQVYCFMMNRYEIAGPKIKKRFMNASDFMFESTAASDVAFSLKMYSAMAAVGANGAVYWHDQNMVRAFSNETLATD